MVHPLSIDETTRIIFNQLQEGFSKTRVRVGKEGRNVLLTKKEDTALIKIFHDEEISGSTNEVREELDSLITQTNQRGFYAGFIFVRAFTDYNKLRNYGAFLQQKWGAHNDVKKLTILERRMVELFSNGKDIAGYESGVVYLNPKRKLENISFRINPLIKKNQVFGYNCDDHCVKGLYTLGVKPEHKTCKTRHNCRAYHENKDLRDIKIHTITPPYKLELILGEHMLARIK